MNEFGRAIIGTNQKTQKFRILNYNGWYKELDEDKGTTKFFQRNRLHSILADFINVLGNISIFYRGVLPGDGAR